MFWEIHGKRICFNAIGPQWVIHHWGYIVIPKVFPFKTRVELGSIHSLRCTFWIEIKVCSTLSSHVYLGDIRDKQCHLRPFDF